MASLKSSTEEQATFVESKGCSPAVFFPVLGIIAFSGFVIHYFHPGFGEMPWAPIKIGCWMITGFFCVVFFTSWGIHNTAPSAFIFDHKNAVVRVQARDGVESYIPYTEINRLDVYVHVRSSKDSTSEYYYGYLEKADGSKWHFVDSVSEEPVRSAVDMLRTKVTSDREFTPSEKSRVSDKIKKEESGRASLLYWTNRAGFRSIQLAVYSILYTGIFGFCIYVILDFSGKFSLQEKMASLLVTGIFGVLLGWLLLRAIRRNLKNLFLQFALSVNESIVEYFEFKKGSGERKASVSFAIDDIVTIRYGFQSWENYKKPLKIISRQNPDKPIELYMDSLTPVECLQVENWLQETLEAKTGRSFKGV